MLTRGRLSFDTSVVGLCSVHRHGFFFFSVTDGESSAERGRKIIDDGDSVQSITKHAAIFFFLAFIMKGAFVDKNQCIAGKSYLNMKSL